MVGVLQPGGKGLLLFHTTKYYIRRLLTMRMKIKLASLLSLLSSLAYHLTGKKFYNSTFQTFSRLESIFGQTRCRLVYKSVEKSGIGILCFVKNQ